MRVITSGGAGIKIVRVKKEGIDFLEQKFKERGPKLLTNWRDAEFKFLTSED